ncbi:hypothetical protein Q8W71_30235 [Methylobacterium sp. NEAU 140]|uniref:hypothetical protein n=1 Tax=Methylobacterium sp. NEAU 140 TaxID=3064945 RepID=UPI0027372E80|nr:hypothetical protein [Methylobacterium sp. NEAU 140]MDP4026877.1 hypothetical protein [Methylobacterium sp. NEAU 140]
MAGLLDRLRGRTTADPGPAEAVPSEAVPTLDRRERASTPAERQLAEAIAQKMLHGWLQNRHQTLMPLSVNLALLPPDERGRVARFAALAATAGTDVTAPARLAAWLAGASADADTLAAYDAALGAPPAFGRTLADVAAPSCAGIAYVLALVAARGDDAGGAGHAFAEYVAERLALPGAARRSARRRHGR